MPRWVSAVGRSAWPSGAAARAALRVSSAASISSSEPASTASDHSRSPSAARTEAVSGSCSGSRARAARPLSMASVRSAVSCRKPYRSQREEESPTSARGCGAGAARATASRSRATDRSRWAGSPVKWKRRRRLPPSATRQSIRSSGYPPGSARASVSRSKARSRAAVSERSEAEEWSASASRWTVFSRWPPSAGAIARACSRCSTARPACSSPPPWVANPSRAVPSWARCSARSEAGQGPSAATTALSPASPFR